MNNQMAIDMLQPGDVLVVDLFGKGEDGTIVGDNLFYYIMKATKSGGLVVDGAMRDLEGISEMDMPAYFRKRAPERHRQRHADRHQHSGSHRQCDGDAGRPGVRRPEGVYFIPPALVQEVVDNADDDPHPRRVDAQEVRRGQVQVERDLRLAARSGAEEGVRGVPEEAAGRDPQEEPR